MTQNRCPEYHGAEKAFLYSSPVLPSPYRMFANAWLAPWSLLLPSPRESDSSEKVLGSEEGRALGALKQQVFPAGSPSLSLELVPHLAGHNFYLLSECPGTVEMCWESRFSQDEGGFFIQTLLE